MERRGTANATASHVALAGLPPKGYGGLNGGMKNLEGHCRLMIKKPTRGKRRASGRRSGSSRGSGRRKGRHPSKDRLKGLLKKPPKGGNCCDTIPEVQARSGCRPALMNREQGLPVVPVPGSRTQTHSRERYSLLHHERSNQRATPFFALLMPPRPRGREAPKP